MVHSAFPPGRPHLFPLPGSDELGDAVVGLDAVDPGVPRPQIRAGAHGSEGIKHSVNSHSKPGGHFTGGQCLAMFHVVVHPVHIATDSILPKQGPRNGIFAPSPDGQVIAVGSMVWQETDGQLEGRKKAGRPPGVAIIPIMRSSQGED